MRFETFNEVSILEDAPQEHKKLLDHHSLEFILDQTEEISDDALGDAACKRGLDLTLINFQDRAELSAEDDRFG